MTVTPSQSMIPHKLCLPGATCTGYRYLQEPDLRTEDRQERSVKCFKGSI
ncbi:hypothetical protein G0U57_010601, partial [Chelydra serpentina]